MRIFTATERTQAIERIVRWSATGTGDLLDLVGQALTVIRSDPTPDELRLSLRFYEYIQRHALPTLNAAARVQELEAKIEHCSQLIRSTQSARRIAALESMITAARAEIVSLS